jgi:hypothetical protein
MFFPQLLARLLVNDAAPTNILGIMARIFHEFALIFSPSYLTGNASRLPQQ